MKCSGRRKLRIGPFTDLKFAFKSIGTVTQLLKSEHKNDISYAWLFSTFYIVRRSISCIVSCLVMIYLSLKDNCGFVTKHGDYGDVWYQTMVITIKIWLKYDNVEIIFCAGRRWKWINGYNTKRYLPLYNASQKKRKPTNQVNIFWKMQWFVRKSLHCYKIQFILFRLTPVTRCIGHAWPSTNHLKWWCQNWFAQNMNLRA